MFEHPLIHLIWLLATTTSWSKSFVKSVFYQMKNLFQPCYAELPEDYNRDVIRCLQTSECIAKYKYKPWYFFENIIEWNNLISKWSMQFNAFNLNFDWLFGKQYWNLSIIWGPFWIYSLNSRKEFWNRIIKISFFEVKY